MCFDQIASFQIGVNRPWLNKFMIIVAVQYKIDTRKLIINEVKINNKLFSSIKLHFEQN